MRRIAASLAVALTALALGACGGDDAEPDAPTPGATMPRGLELILDFQPNPVHAGIYAAIANGDFERAGIAPEIRVPGDSSDAPKLLMAGKVDLAVLDIHDLAIARQQGADLVGIGAIVQRPLAAVIADRRRIGSASDLFGATVGVTGLPSDDAVLEAVLQSSGASGPPPKTPTIGFNSVSALAAGRVDAATAFWNAEGVSLRRLGIETREFRVDRYGAPRYPELILVAARETLEQEPELIEGTLEAINDGYAVAASDPDRALEAMLSQLPSADPDAFGAQMDALSKADAFSPPLGLDRAVLERWARWEQRVGITDQVPNVDRAFDFTRGSDKP